MSELLTPRFVDGIVLEPAGCWGHTNKVQATGYLQATVNGRHGWAHRLMYEALVGPIPAGLCIDHLCRNRSCLNPSHMEPVTIGENNRRGMSPFAVNRRRTKCVNGHVFDAANTYVAADGSRDCRRCRRERMRRYYRERDA